MRAPRAPRAAILVRSLTGGGMERMIVTLAGGLASRGVETSLWVGVAEGALTTEIPQGVELVRLRSGFPLQGRLAAARVHPGGAMALRAMAGATAPGMVSRLPDLARRLAERKPDVLFSAGTQSNLAALWARRLAGTKTRVVVSERNAISAVAREGRGGFRHAYPDWAAQAYPEADAIVAVSCGVADDLARTTGLARERITVLPNPVITPRFLHGAAEAVEHPWLGNPDVPLLLGVGRLHRQKDFPTLLQAFARVRTERPVRLVILGEGEERPRLESLVRQLGVTDDVALPGFVRNPWAWMSRASLFVLSSAWEGIANVVIEALACGCPVVSTDCAGGPRELLSGGIGELAAIGDADSLAGAILRTLAQPPDRDVLKRRVAGYTLEASVDRHLEVLLPGATLAAAPGGNPGRSVHAGS